MQVQNIERPYVHVSELLTEKAAGLNLQVIAGKEGLANRIHFPKIQKPGLALTGFTQYVRPGRVQIFGESELAYLKQLDQQDKQEVGQWGVSPEQLKEKIEQYKQRRAQYEQLKTDLEGSAESQISLTDPQSQCGAGSSGALLRNLWL